ncbi:MAG: RagB/SusD family nutrient uptake outer membrane protein [Rikenellaceae bacterium]|nr:RagB/SusD family nutrient uptake outer membrane protein [Rikenellaceae bacterium]
MKKILLYFVAVAGSCMLNTGCDDFLDKSNYTVVEEDWALHTEEGVNALLNGLYNYVSSAHYYGRHIYAYEMAKGPDIFLIASGGGRFEAEQRYTEGSQSGGRNTYLWQTCYQVIRNATILLEAMENNDIKGDEINLKRIKGEALALRGMAYFDLLRCFSRPPIYSCTFGANYSENYKWGVPLVKTVEMGTNSHKNDIRRATADDSYAYVEENFLEAEALLAQTTTNFTNGHINHAAVCALLMRMYLYMARWDDVITWGEAAERSMKTFGNAMLPYASWYSSYYQPFNVESIFELGYSRSDNLGSDALSSTMHKQIHMLAPDDPMDGTVKLNTGYAAYGIQPAAQKLLKEHPQDVRAYLICDLGVKGYLSCRRYVGVEYPNVHNVPIIRVPEIYLSLAEAWIEKGQTATASNYYDLVRKARTNEAIGFQKSAKEDVLKELLLERRREMMCCGHTYWDFFRRATTFTREGTERAASKTNINFASGTAQWIYPIPYNEMNNNKAIRDQQNPGYAEYVEIEEE